jgi:hypothetical protein
MKEKSFGVDCPVYWTALRLSVLVIYYCDFSLLVRSGVIFLTVSAATQQIVKSLSLYTHEI